MYNALENDAKIKMQNTIDFFKNELSSISVGKVKPDFISGIKVDSYGSKSPISQLANINTLDNTTLSIVPWDVSSVNNIVKAIQDSDLGMTVIKDGKTIRAIAPKVTEERRKHLAKHVSKLSEDIKIKVRNIRRDLMDTLKEGKKNKDISEDEFSKYEKNIQKVTDEFIKKVQDIAIDKEKDIMKV